MSYCKYTRDHPEDSINKTYHDNQYGFPLKSDTELFERLVLEINQAGLSWILILKRSSEFRRAYDHFDVDKVAAYTDIDRNRLLGDAGIIRNRRKIDAAIENARRIQSLRSEFGSFREWLDNHHPDSLENWILIFRNTFIFTGPEIVKEFLLSTGYLPGAHDPDCPVFQKIAFLQPPWMG